MNLARSERQALADLLEEAGPDRPTLCEGWRTKELLAHLLVRERRPDAGLTQLIRPLAGHLKSVTEAFERRPWSEQVGLLRSGPPSWNPMGWGKLEELSNSAEMFIHHEDARRGVPHWKPRVFDAETTAQLTKVLDSKAMRIVLRGIKCGVAAEVPDGRRITMKGGEPEVVVHGAPGEVLLWAFGRDACDVEVTGSDAAISAANGGHRGL